MNQDKIKINNIAVAADVAIFNKAGQVLLGKRLAKAGLGTWGFPGGHILDKENILDAARRELREELGDAVQVNIFNKIIAIRDNSLPPQFIRHLTVILEGEYLTGEILVNEPDRCEKWEWFDLNKLPEPLFDKIGETLQSYINNKSSIV
jgi:8-oxo-dGTP diphosphatase